VPSLKAIRKRIQSVKNTRKITRAMKLVAAAKLRRAQDAIIAARPYSAALARVVSELSGVAGKEAHPLFEERPAKRAAIVVITSDRGLAGAFNSNVIKAVERYAQNELADTSEVTLRIVGKKANQHFARRRANIASYDAAPTSATAAQVAHDTANRVIEDFKVGKVDRVFVVFNEFKNAGTNVVRVSQLLPVIPEKPEKSESAPPALRFDDAAWQARIRKVSNRFRNYPGVLTSHVGVMTQTDTRYLVNTEGARIRHGRGYARFSVSARSSSGTRPELARRPY